MAQITTSYGKAARIKINGTEIPTGMLYGSGYGRNAALSHKADQAAEMLVAAFGLDVEKRGNSDGLSCGAYHEGKANTGFGMGAWLQKDGTITYSALFDAPVRRIAEMRADGLKVRDPVGYKPRSHEMIDQNFPSLKSALAWLKRYAPKYCPALGAPLGGIVDALPFIHVFENHLPAAGEYKAYMLCDMLADELESEMEGGEKPPKISKRTGLEWLHAIQARLEARARELVKFNIKATR
jgi:hypothetical protein